MCTPRPENLPYISVCQSTGIHRGEPCIWRGSLAVHLSSRVRELACLRGVLQRRECLQCWQQLWDHCCGSWLTGNRCKSSGIRFPFWLRIPEMWWTRSTSTLSLLHDPIRCLLFRVLRSQDFRGTAAVRQNHPLFQQKCLFFGESTHDPYSPVAADTLHAHVRLETAAAPTGNL